MQIISQVKILSWGLMALRESDLNGYCPKGILVMFWKRAGFEGGEKETDLLVHAHCIISLFSSISSLFFLRFLSYLFFFSFTLFSFHSVNTLFFDAFFRARQGSFYSACHDQFLPLCPLTTFVWFRRTCQPPKGSSVCHSPLPNKGKFVSFVSPP